MPLLLLLLVWHTLGEAGGIADHAQSETGGSSWCLKFLVTFLDLGENQCQPLAGLLVLLASTFFVAHMVKQRTKQV